MLFHAFLDLPAIGRWTLRHLDEIDHEQRVARIASDLFDLTRDHHGLSTAARSLLRAASIVHDVGRSIDKPNHPVLGARLILRDPALRVYESQRRALAFLTLYHRDEIPELGREAVLNDDDPRDQLRKLLALLRAADALDSRSQETPHLSFTVKKRRLNITAYFDDLDGRTRKVYTRRKKFRMLEDELALDVNIELREAELAKLVA